MFDYEKLSRKLSKMRYVQPAKYFRWKSQPNTSYPEIYMGWLNDLKPGEAFKRCSMPQLYSDTWLTEFLRKLLEAGIIRVARGKTTVYRKNLGWATSAVVRKDEFGVFYPPFGPGLCLISQKQLSDVFIRSGKIWHELLVNGGIDFQDDEGKSNRSPFRLTPLEWQQYAESINWADSVAAQKIQKEEKRKARQAERLAWKLHSELNKAAYAARIKDGPRNTLVDHYREIDLDPTITSKPHFNQRLEHLRLLAEECAGPSISHRGPVKRSQLVRRPVVVACDDDDDSIYLYETRAGKPG